MFKWNPVFNFIMNIKKMYIEMFGEIEYKEYEIDSNLVTCLEYWIYKLGDDMAKNMIRYLELNQKDELILVRYANYNNLGLEQNMTLGELWDLHNGFYLECRSVVINLKTEEIVIAPFRKFRNLNECPENDLSVIINEIKKAKNVEITNKLDGSMQCLRWYKDKVFMSGSHAINPELSWRLKDGYSKLTDNYKEMAKENKNLTFIFEYIALKDAHVVKYLPEQEGLYLVGIRDVYTGRQYSYREIEKFSKKYNIPMAKIFDKTFDEVLEDIKTIKSNDMEGFVINIDGHMIKVKGDDYVCIHKMLSKLSSVNLIIRSIAENTIDDLYSKIPEVYKPRVLAVEKVVNEYTFNMEKNVSMWFNKAPKDNKKSFMIWVEQNVPKKYSNYVKNKYLGNENNYIKHGSRKCPSYKKLNEMGVVDYNKFF